MAFGDNIEMVAKLRADRILAGWRAAKPGHGREVAAAGVVDKLNRAKGELGGYRALDEKTRQALMCDAAMSAADKGDQKQADRLQRWSRETGTMPFGAPLVSSDKAAEALRRYEAADKLFTADQHSPSANDPWLNGVRESAYLAIKENPRVLDKPSSENTGICQSAGEHIRRSPVANTAERDAIKSACDGYWRILEDDMADHRASYNSPEYAAAERTAERMGDPTDSIHDDWHEAQEQQATTKWERENPDAATETSEWVAAGEVERQAGSARGQEQFAHEIHDGNKAQFRVDNPDFKVIESGQWQMDMDGLVETKTSYGQSAVGYFFDQESSQSPESLSEWCGPYKTLDDAAAAAFPERSRAVELAAVSAPGTPSAGLDFKAALASPTPSAPAKPKGFFYSQPQAAENGKAIPKEPTLSGPMQGM
jgi:hypothetical protein